MRHAKPIVLFMSLVVLAACGSSGGGSGEDGSVAEGFVGYVLRVSDSAPDDTATADVEHVVETSSDDEPPVNVE